MFAAHRNYGAASGSTGAALAERKPRVGERPLLCSALLGQSLGFVDFSLLPRHAVWHDLFEAELYLHFQVTLTSSRNKCKECSTAKVCLALALPVLLSLGWLTVSAIAINTLPKGVVCLQARELAQARRLQQDNEQIGAYRVVTVEVFERERCYLDEFAISAPLNVLSELAGTGIHKAESIVGRQCPCTESKTGVP